MPEADVTGSDPQCHVFVYGTLREGGANDITRLSPAPGFVGRARLAGRMYHCGAYPGVVLGGPTQVHGEVYRISRALERQLDEIEEVYPQQRDEYLKRVVGVDVNGQRLECIVYEINPVYVGQQPVIAGGDWLRAIAP